MFPFSNGDKPGSLIPNIFNYLLNEFSYLLSVSSLPALLFVSSPRSWAPVGTTPTWSAQGLPFPFSVCVPGCRWAAATPPRVAHPCPQLTAFVPRRKENEREDKTGVGEVGGDREWDLKRTADVLSFKKYPATQLLCLSVDPELGQIRKVFCLFVCFYCQFSFTACRTSTMEFYFLGGKDLFLLYLAIPPERPVTFSQTVWNSNSVKFLCSAAGCSSLPHLGKHYLSLSNC